MRKFVHSTLSVMPAALAALCVTSTAHAGLGQAVDSVQRDQASLQGTLTVTPMQSYDLHQITTGNTVVREYVSRAGTVFAVTWSGRSGPDLSMILGARYADYSKAATIHRGNHKVFSLTTDDLVMHVTKLPRALVGEAHAPTLFPAGVTARDIR